MLSITITETSQSKVHAGERVKGRNKRNEEEREGGGNVIGN